MTALAVLWAAAAVAAGITLAAAAPHALRPVLGTTALIATLGALATLLLH